MPRVPPEWTELKRRLAAVPPGHAFDQAALADRPEPVRRFLNAAITPGTPLAAGAQLHMRGSLKLGRWMPFRAEQVLGPFLGTVWTARVGGVITGSDQYLDGAGAMDWRLFGRWRVMAAAGEDISHSAAGRVAGESIWVPTAAAAEPDRLRAVADDAVAVSLTVGSHSFDVTHRLDAAGRVVSSSLQRWGDPDRTGMFGLHPFGVEATGWRTFDGVTIPHQGRVGWHFGTSRWPEGEFFRFRIERYELLAPAG